VRISCLVGKSPDLIMGLSLPLLPAQSLGNNHPTTDSRRNCGGAEKSESPRRAGGSDDVIKQGKVVGSRVHFARAGIGVAVKAGAPKPDIGSTEAFKHAMLAAKSIAYSTGASGIIAAKLMERLGIAEQLWSAPEPPRHSRPYLQR
jgi:hypothetical protein